MKPKYFKKSLLFATALLVTVSCFSQTKVYRYTYDNSGNRETRKYIQLKSAEIASTSSETQTLQEFEDLVSGQEIKIYPNPTQGMLNVEIPDLTETGARLVVFNSQGQLIKDIKVNSNLSDVNLSNHPSGMYILKIIIGQETSEWKILKD